MIRHRDLNTFSVFFGSDFSNRAAQSNRFEDVQDLLDSADSVSNKTAFPVYSDADLQALPSSKTLRALDSSGAEIARHSLDSSNVVIDSVLELVFVLRLVLSDWDRRRLLPSGQTSVVLKRRNDSITAATSSSSV